MVRINIYKALLTLCFSVVFLLFSLLNLSAQTLCTKAGTDQYTGIQEGYRYELWNQNAQGTACMTLGRGALFSGEWSGILNYLARRGLNYNQTQEHQEIGRFYSTYDCTYNPSTASGNSYLSVYGWTVEPLVEYYIVEDWRNWIPSMAAGAKSKGFITVNGSTYDIYENTRVNQPSIVGNTTFLQIFSIRRDKRNSGTINITDHFEKWESLGVDLGKLHEVSFVVEGYKSSGTFEFKALDVFLGKDTALGAKELSLPELFSIYPNQKAKNVSIQFHESVSKASVKIYDASGKNIYTQENISNNLVQVSNLTSGVYFVNINSNKLSYNTKLMVF